MNEWYCKSMYKSYHEIKRNFPFMNLKATKISKRCVFVLVTWPWWLLDEWLEGSLNVVGAGTMHGFDSDLMQSRNQVNLHIVVELLSTYPIITWIWLNLDQLCPYPPRLPHWHLHTHTTVSVLVKQSPCIWVNTDLNPSRTNNTDTTELITTNFAYFPDIL